MQPPSLRTLLPVLLTVGAFVCSNALALVVPDGTLDPTFNPAKFTNGQVDVITVQPDGKVLIGGLFAKVNGATRLNIARLLPDGALDPGFNPSAAIVGQVFAITLEPDGQIIIAGPFTQVNGVTRNTIARLNPDGSLDMSFDPGRVISQNGASDSTGSATFPGFVSAVILQPSGAVVVFGEFFHIITGPGSSVPRTAAARFDDAGNFDPTFDAKLSYSATALPTFADVAVQQPSGNIVVAGAFDAVDGNPVPGLARIDPNGGFDGSFTPGSAAGPAAIGGLFQQSDESLVVWGQFTTFNGSPVNRMARMDKDGNLDGGFKAPPFFDYADVRVARRVVQQSDGRLVVAGAFHSCDGAPANGLARLHPDGSRDPSFNSANATGVNGYGDSIAIGTDDRLFFGGYFTTYDGAQVNNLVMTEKDGGLDKSFATDGVTDGNPQVIATGVQSDGRIVVGGIFNSFNGESRYNLLRLNPDGSLDTTFAVTTGVSRSVRAMIILPGDKILIAGQFGGIDGVQRMRMAVLHPDGSIDPSFDPGDGPEDLILAMVRDSAGNIYIGGSFRRVAGVTRNLVAKIDPTGALDMTFDPGVGPTAPFSDVSVRALAAPTGGAGLMVGGNFEAYAGTTARGIARVDSTTGALDTAFATATGTGFSSIVRAIYTTGAGKYVVGGHFTSFNGTPRSRMARLNADGTLDPTFVPPAFSSAVSALLPQGSRTYVGGSFTLPGARLRRVKVNGADDPSFNVGTGITTTPASELSGATQLSSITLQPDGKLLVGGVFNEYNGVGRRCLARITGPTVGVLSIFRPVDLSILLRGIGEPSSTYKLLATDDLSSPNAPFSFYDTITTDRAGEWEFLDRGASQTPKRFYRLELE